MDIAHDLDGLSFVLLTHEHADHLDLGMVRALRTLPILWVIPEPLLAIVEPTGLSREKIFCPPVNATARNWGDKGCPDGRSALGNRPLSAGRIARCSGYLPV